MKETKYCLCLIPHKAKNRMVCVKCHKEIFNQQYLSPMSIVGILTTLAAALWCNWK